jgi:hypothetical protein
MIEPTNNRAERQLRPMFIMRKLTLGKRSDLDTSNQAAIMSTVETGALNGVELLDIFPDFISKAFDFTRRGTYSKAAINREPGLNPGSHTNQPQKTDKIKPFRFLEKLTCYAFSLSINI